VLRKFLTAGGGEPNKSSSSSIEADCMVWVVTWAFLLLGLRREGPTGGDISTRSESASDAAPDLLLLRVPGGISVDVGWDLES